MILLPSDILKDNFFMDAPPDAASAMKLANSTDLSALMRLARVVRDQSHGSVISYSRKVFIPLTQLCRNVCHYCTFAKPPLAETRPYLSAEEVLHIADAGAQAGCHEALFTLGDKPELRYAAARDMLLELGCETTISYLLGMAERVQRETGLLPHVNAGLMSSEDLLALRSVSVSQGLMLESSAERLCKKGGPHHGSPDKLPSARLEMIEAAGKLQIPFTSGILIGIGETRRERIEALLALRDLHRAYGHIQEIIVQNFRRKPGTRMAGAPEPSFEDLQWTIAVARIIFGANANIQAPPNLSPAQISGLIDAGINDLGGVSPVTPDFVNPEAPWPQLPVLEREVAVAGKCLVPRLPVYPEFVQDINRWIAPNLQASVRKLVDAEGFPRVDNWSPGGWEPVPPLFSSNPQIPGFRSFPGSETYRLVERAASGRRLSENEVARLFAARGSDFHIVCTSADELRVAVKGDVVTYIPNCNINYTNICAYKCSFCAFSKGKAHDDLRGKPYNLALTEVRDRAADAWDRGAIEVCLQGGIHPSYTGQTYLDICTAIKKARPALHIHAFSPLEVWQGARTLGVSLQEFLTELARVGLGSLPGTAAEILDDGVRRILCPDKVTTREWSEVIRTAHAVGLKTTSTIMYGHVEQPLHWARHLLLLRDLQLETGGFTEFVPLPFVHMEAPLFRRGLARRGPTFREAVLMHAVARLVLHTAIDNIQASWVKMGPDGIRACLGAGANDLGGTLMNESISRAAGAAYGQEMTPGEFEEIIRAAGRRPARRTSLYDTAAYRNYVSATDQYLQPIMGQITG